MKLTTLYYSTPTLSYTSTHDLVDIHNTRHTRLKLSDAQRLASPYRPRKLPKPTLVTAKHSVLHGCIPRYALALKTASKVSDTSLPSVTRSRLDRHSQQEDVDFVVSQNLITAGNGSHTLHPWLDKRADAKHKAVSLKKSTSTLTRFKLSKASAHLHNRNIALALNTPSAITSLSSSTKIKLEVPGIPVSVRTTPRGTTLPIPPPATKHSRYSEFLKQELAKPGEL